jgi:toxin ParE1/3/4
MKLIWSEESLMRLIDIEAFIAEDNPIIAEQFIDYIISESGILKDNPMAGRIVPEISNPEIRELIVRNYRVVYRVKGNNVEILTVFEAHRLLKRNEIYPDE